MLNYFTGARPYGALSLTVSSPQILPIEPITMAQAKELPKVQHNEEDSLIYSLITTARIAAEKETGFELAVKQYDLVLDDLSSYDEIELPGPLQSVDLISYRDSDAVTTVLVEDTHFTVDTARNLVVPKYATPWPTFTPHPTSAVLVRFRSGYPPSHPFWSNEGQAVMTGMKFLITDWLVNRDTSISRGAEEMPFRVKYLFGLFARQRAR